MTVEQAKKNLQTVAQECINPYSNITWEVNISPQADIFGIENSIGLQYEEGRKMLKSLTLSSSPNLDTTWLGRILPAIERPIDLIAEQHRIAILDLNNKNLNGEDVSESIDIISTSSKKVATFLKVCMPSLRNAISYLRQEINKTNSDASPNTDETSTSDPNSKKPGDAPDDSPTSAERWGIKFTWGNILGGVSAGPDSSSTNGSLSGGISSGISNISIGAGTNLDLAAAAYKAGKDASKIKSGNKFNNGTGGLGALEGTDISRGTWYMALLPSMRSTMNMQGGQDTPGAMPGLSIKVIPNVVKHRIPGFQPVYQHMGVDTVMITMVGTFTGADGFDPAYYSSDMNYPNMLKGNTDGQGRLLSFVSAYDSYRSFNEFYRIAVLDSNELTVEINMARNNDIMKATALSNGITSNLRDESSGNPKFKGFIRRIEAFHARSDRTWYTIDLEVTDHGMMGTEPVNLTNLVEEALDGAESVEKEETPSNKKCTEDLINKIRSGGSGWKDLDIDSLAGSNDLGVASRKRMAYNVNTCQVVFYRETKDKKAIKCEPGSETIYSGKGAVLQIIQRIQSRFPIAGGGKGLETAVDELLGRGSKISLKPQTPSFDPLAPLNGTELYGSSFTTPLNSISASVMLISSGRLIRKQGGNATEIPVSDYSDIYSKLRGILNVTGRPWEDIRVWISNPNVEVCSASSIGIGGGGSIPLSRPLNSTRSTGNISYSIDQGPIGVTPQGLNTLMAVLSPYRGNTLYTSDNKVFITTKGSTTYPVIEIVGLAGSNSSILKVKVVGIGSPRDLDINVNNISSVSGPSKLQSQSSVIWRSR